MHLSEELLNEVLPSGESRYHNQVGWARYHLVQEGLVSSSKHGVWSLTEVGQKTHLTLQQARDIRKNLVRMYMERRKTRSDQSEPLPDAEPEVDEANPTESKHRAEVLGIMHSLPATGFEKLCQRILREAGFQEVVVTGRSGDQGIDGHGTLQINALVSFKVLFQCKRYKDSGTPSQVRDFRGAMSGRADKGIILTTGSFTAEARREASRDGVPPIELIDGDRLVSMLEGLELGLTPVKAFEIDTDFFSAFRV